MEVAELIALGRKAAVAYGRDDLAERLDGLGARVGDDRSVVLVVGDYKAGKSSLVNALVGVAACPVDVDDATAVPTVLAWAEQPTAAILRDANGDGRIAERVPLADLRQWVTEVPAAERSVACRADVGLPAPALAGGLVVADTPGIGGLGSPTTAATLAFAPLADAVLFVSPCTRELTAPEFAFLDLLARRCPAILVVKSKTDLQARWMEVAAADGEHLRDAGHPEWPVGASAALAATALESGDADLDQESGIPAILDWLAATVARCRRGSVEVASAEVGEVTATLRAALAAERATLDDAGAAEEMAARLDAAVAEMDAARKIAGRLAVLMGDVFTDVSGELDADVRERIRALVAEADASVDAADPAGGWPEIGRTLQARVAATTAAHAAARHQLLGDAVARIVDALGTAGALDDELLGGAPTVTDTDAIELPGVETRRSGVVGQALTLLRSSYGGLAMLGFLGNFAGIALAAPAMAGVGLLLGGRGLRDERQRALTQRRAQAKGTARHYLDDVSFALLKESRELLRQVQRTVRDHAAARADERVRTAADTLAAVRRASEVATADRSARIRDLDAELARLDRLASRAAVLASGDGDA